MKLKHSLSTLLLAVTATVTVAQEPAVTHPGSDEVPVTGTLPVMYINTDNNEPITQKETYLQATYWIDAMGIDGYASVASEAEPLPLEIRGRGNSSWTNFPKKPYKIKLGKKTSLLGMPKHKHFALIAHFPSMELLNNALAFELSDRIGLPWSPKIRPVEVVLNGYNIGLYALTESIKIDPERINIFEQEDGNTDPSTLSGGWLMEIDNYDDPCQVTIIDGLDGQQNQLKFTYKSPEDLSTEQKEWITDELKNITDRIYHTDPSDNSWEDYIDIESIAKTYIINELCGNLDAFQGSTYFYKALDSKWQFSPLWDMGWSFTEMPRHRTFYEIRDSLSTETYTVWLDGLWRKPRFRQTVLKLWNDFYPEKLDGIQDYITNYCHTISKAFKRNYEEIWPVEYWDIDYVEWYLRTCISDSADWMNTYLQTSGIGQPGVDTLSPDAINVSVIGSNLIRIDVPDNNISHIEIFDLRGAEITAVACGDNTYRIPAANGYYVVRANLSTGRSAVAKFRL